MITPNTRGKFARLSQNSSPRLGGEDRQAEEKRISWKHQ